MPNPTANDDELRGTRAVINLAHFTTCLTRFSVYFWPYILDVVLGLALERKEKRGAVVKDDIRQTG